MIWSPPSIKHHVLTKLMAYVSERTDKLPPIPPVKDYLYYFRRESETHIVT